MSSFSKLKQIHTINEFKSVTNKTMNRFIDDVIKAKTSCLTRWDRHENTDEYKEIKSKLITETNNDSIATNRYPHCWIAAINSINDIELKYRISFEFAFKIIICHCNELYISSFMCSYYQLKALHDAAINSKLFPTATYPRVHPNVIQHHRTEELNNDIQLENLYTTLENKLRFTGPRKRLFSRKPVTAQQEHLDYFCIVLNTIFNCSVFAMKDVLYDILNTYNSQEKHNKTVNIHPDLVTILKQKALNKLKRWRDCLKCQLRLYSTPLNNLSTGEHKTISKCEFRRFDSKTKKYSIVVNRNELKDLFCSTYHSAFVVSRNESVFVDHWAIILEGTFYLLLVQYNYDATQQSQNNGVVSYQIFKNDNNGQKACWYSAKKTSKKEQLFNERWSTLSKSYLLKSSFGKRVNFKFINELVENIWMKDTQFSTFCHNCQHFVRDLYSVLDAGQAKFLNVKLEHKQLTILLPSGPIIDQMSQIFEMEKFIQTAKKEVKFVECKDNDNYNSILNVFVDNNIKELCDEKFEEIKSDEYLKANEEHKLNTQIQSSHQSPPISIQSKGQMFPFVKSTFHCTDTEFINPYVTSSTRAPLCPIAETEEHKEEPLTTVPLPSYCNNLKHLKNQCANCPSLEKLIFQLMKEVERLETANKLIKVKMNETNALQNSLRSETSEQQYSNNRIIEENKQIMSNNQNGYNSESSSTLNLQSSLSALVPINTECIQKRRKKRRRKKNANKSLPRILTNQYTRKHGVYATYTPISPTKRAQGNIQISKEFTGEIIPGLITENISNVFLYIDIYTALQNGYEYNDGKLRIFNYDFHSNIDGNQLYCVVQRQNENRHRGYKWSMKDKLFTSNEIESIYNVSSKRLPKAEELMRYQINAQHMAELIQLIELETFIFNTKWHKVPVYSKNPKRRICRCKLSLTTDEFTTKLVPKRHKQLFPILMFRDDKPLIQYVYIAEIVEMDYVSLFQSQDLLSKHCSIVIISIILEYTSGSKEIVSKTDIGIAFEYNKHTKCCRPVGIHLDRNSMFDNYQLLFRSNSMHDLDDFYSKYDDLQIGDVDENETMVNRMKHTIEQLNQKIERLSQPFSEK